MKRFYKFMLFICIRGVKEVGEGLYMGHRRSAVESTAILLIVANVVAHTTACARQTL